MDENIASLMSQVTRLFRRSFDERARTIGLTRPQWHALSIISQNQGSNQGVLAELLEVEPITLGRMLDRLQDSCMIERRADPSDRRAWRVFLTDKGEALLDQLRPMALELLDSALEGVSEADAALMLDILRKMRGKLTRKGAAECVNHG